jgi:hypothetical protein
MVPFHCRSQVHTLKVCAERLQPAAPGCSAGDAQMEFSLYGSTAGFHSCAAHLHLAKLG